MRYFDAANGCTYVFAKMRRLQAPARRLQAPAQRLQAQRGGHRFRAHYGVSLFGRRPGSDGNNKQKSLRDFCFVIICFCLTWNGVNEHRKRHYVKSQTALSNVANDVI